MGSPQVVAQEVGLMFESSRCIETGLPCVMGPKIELHIDFDKLGIEELRSFVINFKIISIFKHHDVITRSGVKVFQQFLISGP